MKTYNCDVCRTSFANKDDQVYTVSLCVKHGKDNHQSEIIFTVEDVCLDCANKLREGMINKANNIITNQGK